MKFEIKELTKDDGLEIYEMIIEIGLAENGFTNCFPTESFELFSMSLNRYVEQSKGINVSDQYVPQTIYWLYIDAKPVGFGKLRHTLNEKLREYGGHIGYIIRPSERGKRYGTVLLSLLLNEAKKKEIHEVLITCDEDNIRSRKVIESNKGELQEVKNRICKYWIKAV